MGVGYDQDFFFSKKELITHLEENIVTKCFLERNEEDRND